MTSLSNFPFVSWRLTLLWLIVGWVKLKMLGKTPSSSFSYYQKMTSKYPPPPSPPPTILRNLNIFPLWWILFGPPAIRHKRELFLRAICWIDLKQTFWLSLLTFWLFNLQQNLLHAFFISNTRLKLAKKFSKSEGTPWGWPFAIWNLIIFSIHVLILSLVDIE